MLNIWVFVMQLHNIYSYFQGVTKGRKMGSKNKQNSRELALKAREIESRVKE